MEPENRFASELLHELKLQNKRLCITLYVIIALWFSTICGFLIYLSLPVNEISIENDEGNANYIGGDLDGGIINGEDKN